MAAAAVLPSKFETPKNLADLVRGNQAQAWIISPGEVSEDFADGVMDSWLVESRDPENLATPYTATHIVQSGLPSVQRVYETSRGPPFVGEQATYLRLDFLMEKGDALHYEAGVGYRRNTWGNIVKIFDKDGNLAGKITAFGNFDGPDPKWDVGGYYVFDGVFGDNKFTLTGMNPSLETRTQEIALSGEGPWTFYAGDHIPNDSAATMSWDNIAYLEAVVPEPDTLTLVVLGAAALGVAKYRQMQNTKRAKAQKEMR